MSSRIDAVSQRVQTAVTMKQVVIDIYSTKVIFNIAHLCGCEDIKWN